MEKRLERDINAFKCVDPILTFRCWEILVSIGAVDFITRGATIKKIIKKTRVKNEKMLECMVNFLVGKGALKISNEKYYVSKVPNAPSKEDFLFLYSNYFKSMLWVDSVTLSSASVLISGKPLDLMGFGSKSNLSLWESIMSESPFSFRQFIIEKILSINKKELSILDFGCGGGMAIEQFIETTTKPISITGVDPSEFYLKKALERKSHFSSLIEQKKSNVKLMVYNFQKDLDIEEKYDAIFMSLVLNHLDEKERDVLFKKLNSYLKDGGKIGIYQIVNSSDKDRSPLCWTMHVVPSHKCYPVKSTYKNALEKYFNNIEEYFAGNVIFAEKSIQKK